MSFYRDKFGFKEGDSPVKEKAGRTSMAIPFLEVVDAVIGSDSRRWES